MTDPILVARDAIVGIDVGMSVSDSADLDRLGLDPRHVELAVGELTRAVLVAGGRVLYGGNLRPSGFTHQLMAEVRRFGTSRHSFTIVLAQPEHCEMTVGDLDHLDRNISTWGRVILLDADGNEVPLTTRRMSAPAAVEPSSLAAAYSALRRFIADVTRARVLVGGKLEGYLGSMPGVVEEAISSIERGQPLYIAGGFGGAAALVARALGYPMDWLPKGAPEGAGTPGTREAISRLEEVTSRVGWSPESDGLSADERALLAASHRPADIASLSVLGMSRAFGEQGADSGAAG